MEPAVGVDHGLVPVGDFVAVDVQRVLEAAQHLVRGVRILDEERVRAAGGFGGVVVEHGRDADVAAGERECPRGKRLEDDGGGGLAEVGRKEDVGCGEDFTERSGVLGPLGKRPHVQDVGVLVREILVVVPFGVVGIHADDDEYVLLGDVGEDGGERFGGLAGFFVEVDVEGELRVEVDAQLLLEGELRLVLRFLDGEVLFAVEVPHLVAHAELHPDEFVGVVVQEPAESAGQVRVEHGVPVAGRGEQDLLGVADARLQEAHLAPEFVAVHVEVLRGQSNLLDFARRDMEVVGDVMDVEEEGGAACVVRVGGAR